MSVRTRITVFLCCALTISLRPDLSSPSICPGHKVRFYRHSIAFVGLLRRVAMFRSFNILFYGSLSFNVSRVGQVGLMLSHVVTRITVPHRHGASFPWSDFISGYGTFGTSTFTPGYFDFPNRSTTSCDLSSVR